MKPISDEMTIDGSPSSPDKLKTINSRNHATAMQRTKNKKSFIVSVYHLHSAECLTIRL